MAGKNSKEVVVAVDEQHQHQMSEVVGKLRQKGFVLSESLESIGVLTGSVPADALQDLKEVEGVASVEENRTDYKPQ